MKSGESTACRAFLLDCERTTQMGKLDLSRELEYANRCAKEFIDSADSLEKKYADLLSTAFAAACRVCFQFGDNRPLEIMDLLLLLRAKWEMHRQEFADLRFDGWPETPDMVFNVFEGNSAREIAGMFTAAMVERLYAADKQGALLELEEEGKVDESALNEWALRAAAELRNRIDLSNPVYVKRDAKVLYRMLQKEAERFFAGGENGELLILREKEKIVLRYLAKIPDLKQYQSDIESGTDLSRKTIAKILNSLYSKGLVIKHKRGVSITPKGLKHAKESP